MEERLIKNAEQQRCGGGETDWPFSFFRPTPLPPSDRLYFAILKQKVKSTADRHCFCVDEELAYEK